MMPKISIITTTYNHESFIADAIDSVLSQSFTDWELLIGDDKSSDKTYLIACEYAKKDPRIRVWQHSENLGIVGNMNFLLSHANKDAEYVTFLEGDDVYFPKNLSTKVDIFQKHPDILFFYNHWSQLNQSGNHKKINTIKYSQRECYNLESLLAIGNPIQSFGVVALRRILLEKYLPVTTPSGNTSGMFGPLDYWMWVRILPGVGIYYCDEPLFGYRVHGNNFVKNVARMNGQFEEIYLKIISESDNPKVKYIAEGFVLSNKVVSAFFTHNRLGVWKFAIKHISHGVDRRTIFLLFLSVFPWFMIDILYKLKQKYA